MRVKVITKKGCSNCNAAKAYLKKIKLPFDEVDLKSSYIYHVFDDDINKAMTMPVITLDDNYYDDGFNPPKLDKLKVLVDE
jgi:glutaredoxin